MGCFFDRSDSLSKVPAYNELLYIYGDHYSAVNLKVCVDLNLREPLNRGILINGVSKHLNETKYLNKH